MSHNQNFGQAIYTTEEQETIAHRLDMRLGPEYVSHRQGPGGSRVPYLEGNKAVELANKVFGFNGWSTSVVELTVDYLDEVNGRFNVGISCVVRVTVKDGAFRENIGYGSMMSARQKGEAFEKAKKEAVTDAMKRCLKDFGNALGNCIYDKEYLKHLSKCPSTSRLDLDQNKIIRPGVEWDSYRAVSPNINASVEEVDLTVSNNSKVIAPLPAKQPEKSPHQFVPAQQSNTSVSAPSVASNASNNYAKMTNGSTGVMSNNQMNTNRPNENQRPPNQPQTMPHKQPNMQNGANQPHTYIQTGQVAQNISAKPSPPIRQMNPSPPVNRPVVAAPVHPHASLKSDIPFDDMDESMVLNAMEDFDIPGLGSNPNGKRQAPAMNPNHVQQKRQFF